jgi:hypothetical protein
MRYADGDFERLPPLQQQVVSLEVRQVEPDHYDLVGIRQITEPI